MEAFFIVFGIGILLGFKHAFDVDHIVAVNTLLSSTKNILESMKLSFFWGLGHTLTLTLVGFIFLMLNLSLPENLIFFFEFLVGLLLIFLGIGTLHKQLEKKLLRINYKKKSLGIGMVHGLAGSGALLLLVLVQTTSFLESLSYIALFGLGSILGMILVGTFLYVSLNKIKYINISKFAGTLSIIVGLFIVYETSLFLL